MVAAFVGLEQRALGLPVEDVVLAKGGGSRKIESFPSIIAGLCQRHFVDFRFVMRRYRNIEHRGAAAWKTIGGCRCSTVRKIAQHIARCIHQLSRCAFG